MHTVAVVQAGSVPFDAEASVDKAIARLREAAGNGAELVVFPEAFIGGYPKGSTFGAPVGMRTGQGRAQFERYFDGAVTVDGPEMNRLAEAAREVGAFVVIGFLLPYTDGKLAKSAEGDITASPFTLIFEKAGVAGAASVMNAVILTAILSAGSSGLFASTRMLYALAQRGMAPKFLLTTNKRAVPMPALLLTAAVALLCYGLSLLSEDAYGWLIAASGLAGFITWCGIAWSHLKFRRAYVAQGYDLADLPFRAKWFPLGPIIALAMCAAVIVMQNSDLFLKGSVDPGGLLESYIGLPLFLGAWGIHKLVTKSRKVQPLEADLTRSHTHD